MFKKISYSVLLLIGFILIPAAAFAESANKVDTGDTVFVLVSSALVFLMTPGLAFFYGGMVRKKNVLNTMMNSFVVIGVIAVQWILVGYTLSFGPDKFHLIGGFDWLGLKGVTGMPNPDYAATIPHSAFALYQMMFAIITPALISGAFAERMRFPSFLLLVLLWSTLVYDPLAHWVWGAGGWLRQLGALDFAGGTVIHISSGVSGLVAAIFLGKRKSFKKSPMIPHNVPFVMLGAAILWFGWLGFNAGSALQAGDGIAVNAALVTCAAAAASLLSWLAIERLHHGKPTILGALTGAIVGLVAITPAAGFVTPVASIMIGLTVSPLCYFFISVVKIKLGYDDTLDAFGCHGVGGIWGALATGIFATKTVNPNGNDGLLYGNPHQLYVQILSIAASIIVSAALTYLILKVISLFTRLRVDENSEAEGLDISEHGEEAYPDITGEQGLII